MVVPDFPASCDTFCALQDVTADTYDLGPCIIFGKNSDRPKGEVQELVYVRGEEHAERKHIKCTYITIPQFLGRTQSCLLSKPAWMWGAEMGCNESGVVIGNEAVWNKLSDDEFDLEPRLLGMDLLRLGLERGASARGALEAITELLEAHGQGGQCSDIMEDFSYHNSFLIADSKEVWILETARQYWVAEKVTSGVRNISNCMSITTNITLSHKGLAALAKEKGWLKEGEKLNWRSMVGGEEEGANLGSASERWYKGKELLIKGAKGGKFTAASMMEVLKDQPSLICRPYESNSPCPTASSQISVLSPGGVRHFFTGTPDPGVSLFKPVPSFKAMAEWPEGKQLAEEVVSPVAFPKKAKRRSDYAHPLFAASRKCMDTIASESSEKLTPKLLEMQRDIFDSKEEKEAFSSWTGKEMSLLKELSGE